MLQWDELLISGYSRLHWRAATFFSCLLNSNYQPLTGFWKPVQGAPPWASSGRAGKGVGGLGGATCTLTPGQPSSGSPGQCFGGAVERTGGTSSRTTAARKPPSKRGHDQIGEGKGDGTGKPEHQVSLTEIGSAHKMQLVKLLVHLFSQKDRKPTYLRSWTVVTCQYFASFL